jgi:hypothetical protein
MIAEHNKIPRNTLEMFFGVSDHFSRLHPMAVVARFLGFFVGGFQVVVCLAEICEDFCVGRHLGRRSDGTESYLPPLQLGA